MPKQAISPEGAPPALGPYSHAIRIGDLLFCSGQVPIDPAHPVGPVGQPGVMRRHHQGHSPLPPDL